MVGGGNSAVDAAIELAHWGARVTIVHFGPELDPNVKPWVRPDIDGRIRTGQIQAFFGSRLAARFFYPAGKTVRNLLLKMLGIGWIDNLGRHRPAAR